jgi:hypothetical protein
MVARNGGIFIQHDIFFMKTYSVPVPVLVEVYLGFFQVRVLG